MRDEPDFSSRRPRNCIVTDSRGAAAPLGTTERHIRRLTSERNLPFLKVGGKVRFRLSDIDEYIDRQLVPVEQHGPQER